MPFSPQYYTLIFPLKQWLVTVGLNLNTNWMFALQVLAVWISINHSFYLYYKVKLINVDN